MAVSLKTDLRFPESGQHGHGSRIIQQELVSILTFSNIPQVDFLKSMVHIVIFREQGYTIIKNDWMEVHYEFI